MEKQPTRVVLDVGGVGYELSIPLSSYDRLPAVDERCRIFTYDYIREDQHSLFGFMTQAERSMFDLLMGVNGIGPKLALSALSGLSIRQIKTAVAESDVNRLSSISGVGRKKAERIVIELRDKLSEGEALEATHGAAEGGDTRLRDAVLALIALGYKQSEGQAMVREAMKKCSAGAGVEEIIRMALAQ